MLTMNIRYELSVPATENSHRNQANSRTEKDLLTSMRFETGQQEVEIEKIFLVCFV